MIRPDKYFMPKENTKPQLWKFKICIEEKRNEWIANEVLVKATRQPLDDRMGVAEKISLMTN